PADYGWKCAGSATDDNILWRLPLQPHRVHDDIEEDRKGEQRGDFDIKRKSEDGHGAAGKDKSKYKRLGTGDLPTRNGTSGGAGHHSVDVSVTPHIENAGRASSCGNGKNCNGSRQRVEVTGRNDHSDETGEDVEQHHPWFHQRDEIR